MISAARNLQSKQGAIWEEAEMIRTLSRHRPSLRECTKSGYPAQHMALYE